VKLKEVDWLHRSALVDWVLYILDEPTIGLHSRDNHQLIETLKISATKAIQWW
jgi:excinuclease UvrABC ATPase subunit